MQDYHDVHHDDPIPLPPPPILANPDDSASIQSDDGDHSVPAIPQLRETVPTEDNSVIHHNDESTSSSSHDEQSVFSEDDTDDNASTHSTSSSTSDRSHDDDNGSVTPATTTSSQRNPRAKDSIDAEISNTNIIDQNPDDRPSTQRYNMRAQVTPKPPSDFSSRYGFAFTQMSAREGLKRFGERAANALIDEWVQLDRLEVFEGANFYDVTPEHRKKALRLVQLIKEKRCGKIKGRTCADGRKQRDYISRDEAKSPTVSQEALILSCVTDAHGGRVVVTAEVPGAFYHL